MVEEQEIELIDYLNVIWGRKGLIMGGTLLAAVTTLGVKLSTPKTYEISRTLKIGQFRGKAIESGEAIMNRLRDHRALAALIKEFHLDMIPEQVAAVISAKTSTRNSDGQVRYSVKASDPQLAMRMADWLAGKIIKTHQRIFERAIQIVNEHKGELEATIHNVEREISNMKSLFENIARASKIDPPKLFLLEGNIEGRERNLANLRRELRDIHLSVLPPDSENTAVLAADAAPWRPVNPKVKLNVILAGGLGLLSFTFLAFCLDYMTNVRAGRNQK